MTPDPWQDGVLRSDADRVLLLCSRQAGKSSVSAALAISAALLRRLGKHARPALPALEEARKTATGFAKSMIPGAIGDISGDSTKPYLDVLKDPKAPLEKRLEVVRSLSWAKPEEKVIAALVEALNPAGSSRTPSFQLRNSRILSFRPPGELTAGSARTPRRTLRTRTGK